MMRDKKTLKDPFKVTLALEKNYVDYLKNLTLEMSFKGRKKITVTELIRDAIENAYPMTQDSHNNSDYDKTGTDQN